MYGWMDSHFGPGVNKPSENGRNSEHCEIGNLVKIVHLVELDKQVKLSSDGVNVSNMWH